MTPLRIGVHLQPQRCAYVDIRRVLARVEALNADMVLNWDHFSPMCGPPTVEAYECWTVLSAWVEATSLIEFGAPVNSITSQNPDLLADMSRNLDHISERRFVLGIGAGWYEKDHEEYGLEFAPFGAKPELLAQGLNRIQQRLTRLDPAPIRKVPVPVGGNGLWKPLRLAAQYADMWHSFGDEGQLIQRQWMLNAWCLRIGQYPAEITRSTRLLRRDPEDVGIRLLTLVLQVPAFDAGHVEDWLAFRDAFDWGEI